MAFDPFLYVALGLGWLLGRIVPHRGARWLPPATFVAVALLLGFLGASLRAVGPGTLLATFPSAALFVTLLVGATAGISVLLAGARAPVPALPAELPLRPVATSAALFGAVVVGLLAGTFVPFPAQDGISLTLYVLLGLVGFGLELGLAPLRRAWAPIAAAVAGALLASAAFAAIARIAWNDSFAVGLAFGWYSLAGPLVAARAGATLGLLAFLTNFLRELLTMTLAPYLGRRLRGEGISALGGATSMDTTLAFVTRYGSRESGPLALASGLVLTVAAGVVLPLFLAL